ncbi:MAG: methionyl-tRNA formyltransferase [Candidatus Omnitrophica bacterium]|nr:methionyl-tRNA formyltransferase [Candidatus Omnitrophota bacterium]
MRIIFWGSSEFGIPCLEKIKQAYNLVAIVTAVDKPCGRHLKILPGPVKLWAVKNNIKCFQPEKLTGNDDFYKALKEIEPDLFVVISYGKIIPEKFLRIPKLSSINVHPSLLPKFRGPAPIEWAIVNGEKETGVTVIVMDENIDTGKILSQKVLNIEENDDIFTLREKLSLICFDVLKDAIARFVSGYRGIEQTGKVSYAPKLKKSDGKINWNDSAISIHNKIRGFADWPGAYSFLISPKRKKLLKIKKSEVEKETGKYTEPGRFVDLNKKILVACGQGVLRIEKIQEEGKRQQTAIEYLNGHLNILKDSYLQ